jgi:hypothetical protein
MGRVEERKNNRSGIVGLAVPCYSEMNIFLNDFKSDFFFYSSSSTGCFFRSYRFLVETKNKNETVVWVKDSSEKGFGHEFGVNQ